MRLAGAARARPVTRVLSGTGCLTYQRRGRTSCAELEPGDAIFIPYGWYHHVEALERFNMLVNYWWDPARDDIGSPWDAMLHGMLSLKSLPANQRAAWRAMFDHYVFEMEGDPAAHIPADMAGVLGPVTADTAAQMRKSLIEALNSPALK